MAELPSELAHLLDTAKSSEISLTTRLRALASLTQTLNCAITKATVQQPGHYYIEQPYWLEAWSLTTTDIANTFKQISQVVHNQVLPLLAQHHILFSAIDALSAEQSQWVHEYFLNRVYPLLTPLAVDPGRPFPYISSDSLNYLVLLQAPTSPVLGRPRSLFARVKVPRHAVPRIVQVPDMTAKQPHPENHCLIWMVDLIRYFAQQLFPGMAVLGLYQFHVLRAAVTPTQELDEVHIRQQKAAPVVRLDIEERAPQWLVRWLVEHLDIPIESVVSCVMPLQIASLADLADQVAPILHSLSS